MKFLSGALLGVFIFAANGRADVIFSQNFDSAPTLSGSTEGTFGNFTVNSTGFPIGIPAIEGISAISSNRMGHATSYLNNEYSYYQISSLDLTNLTNVKLSFDYAGLIEPEREGFNLLVGFAGTVLSVASNLLAPSAGSQLKYISGSTPRAEIGSDYYDSSASSGGGAGLAAFDLSAYIGGPVDIRFQFGSDDSIPSNGFNFDNIIVTADSVAVPEPATVSALGLSFLVYTGWRRKEIKKHRQ